MIDICGADQREVALIRNGENDPAVSQLQKVGLGVVKQTFGDDMAAANKAQTVLVAAAHITAQHGLSPRSGGIDDGFCTHLAHPAAGCFDLYVPDAILAARIAKGRACQNVRAMHRCRTGIQNDKARILNPAVRIFKGQTELVL